MRRLAWVLLLGGLAAGELGAASGADLVLTHGNIYTGDSRLGRVEALAIVEGKIAAVGTAEEIRHWVGPNTTVLDLEGRFVLPGFNDAHTHLAGAGFRRLQVNLEGSRSLEEFQGRIRARLGEFSPGEWIQGDGWDQSLWPENRMPTRADLDAVSTEHPMFLGRVDGHSAVANSRALALAGIDRSTPNPEGGEIVRDAAGDPTGWLKEKAVDLVAARIPPPSREQRRRALLLALEDASRHGVTSVQDNSEWEDFLALREIQAAGQLPVRVTEWLPFAAPLPRLEEMRRQGGAQDAWLKTGALKAITDGSGGSLSAAMLEPFANAPGNRGLLLFPPEQLEKMVIDRDAAGFQIALHAIGDRANRVVLDAFQAAQKMNQRQNARHRIEHAQYVDPEDKARFRPLGVIASLQPCHLLSDLRWTPAILGPERYSEAYAWNSLREAGAILAFGTDYPVEPVDPLRGLYAALTREFEAGGPYGGWRPEEKISIFAALRAYTWGSAYAEFEEHRKGTLAPGFFADLVVLSQDVTRIPASELLRTEVLLTVVGGRRVYEKR